MMENVVMMAYVTVNFLWRQLSVACVKMDIGIFLRLIQMHANVRKYHIAHAICQPVNNIILFHNQHVTVGKAQRFVTPLMVNVSA